MKQVLLAVLAAGVITGCDKDKDEENSINLEGAWSQACRADSDDSGNVEGHKRMRLEFNGGELSVIANQHGPDDTNCETILVETVFKGNYVTGADADHQTAVEGASPLDLTMTAVKITPKTAEGVQMLIADSFCDRADWTLDTAYEYTEASGCSDLSNSSDGPPPPGQMWHLIFRADAENVFFGNTHDGSGNDGSTAAKAPVALENEPFTRA